MEAEKTETKETKKRFEVTMTKTATFTTTIEVEAENEEEADRLAIEQAENGEHDEAFADYLDEENIEVTETNCLDEDED